MWTQHKDAARSSQLNILHKCFTLHMKLPYVFTITTVIETVIRAEGLNYYLLCYKTISKQVSKVHLSMSPACYLNQMK